jgi:hypothetical protein
VLCEADVCIFLANFVRCVVARGIALRSDGAISVLDAPSLGSFDEPNVGSRGFPFMEFLAPEQVR